MMKRTLLLIAAVGFFTMDLWGQASGDYRSAGTGPWGTAGTWETFNGATWVAAGAAPTSANGVITIRSPHVVNVAANVTIDQTVVDAGGTMTIDAGIIVTLANGLGTEITLNGVLNNNGTLAFTGAIPNRTVLVSGTVNNLGAFTTVSASKLTFAAGSNYFHLFTDAGTIPTATWNPSSTLNIVGYASGGSVPPAGLNQAFGNFIWNSPNQDATVNLNGQPITVAGNFRVLSTGIDALYHSLGAGGNLSIGGSFEVLDAAFGFVSGTTGTLTINGDIHVHGSDGYVQLADDQNLHLICNGNFLLEDNAIIDFSATSAVTTFDLRGNYTQTGGSIYSSGADTNLNFLGSTTQIYTSVLTPAGGAINYSIGNGATLSLPGINFLGGSGTFSLLAGGTLQVGSTQAGGAIQTGPFSGNLQVSGTRTFATGSTVVYNGTSAQFIGSGHPSSVSTQIANSSGVSLASDITFNGSLTLVSGNLSVQGNTLTIGGDFTPGTSSVAVLPTSSISITGNGTFPSNPGGTLPLAGAAPLTINNFTLNRSNGRVYVFDDLIVSGTFTLASGILDIRGFLFTMNGNIALTGGQFAVNEFARMQVTGTGTISGNANFTNESAGGLPMLAIAMNRPSSTFTIGSNLDLSILNLVAGAFAPSGTFRMGTGGTITRTDGTMTTAPGAISSYNVVYNGSSSISTGPELPYNPNTTRLTNLTNQGAGTVTLSQPTTINGTLTLTNGTFDAAANGVTFKGNIVSNASGVFTASPVIFDGTSVISGSIPLTLGAFQVNSAHSLNLGTGTTVNIAGDVINNGTISGGTSTAIFNGTTTLTNTNDALLLGSFNNVQITGALTLTLVDFIEPVPDTDLYRIEVSGDWTVTGGTFTAGTSRVDFNGTGAQTITSGAQNFYSTYFLGSGVATLGSALRSTNDMMISATSSVDVSTDNYLVAVSEDFIADGTFTARQGTLLLNGIGRPQSITRTTGTGPIHLYTLRVNKTGAVAAVSILTNVDIEHFLTVVSATTVNAGTNLLRLLSDATATARVTTLGAGAVINGSVIVQRHMPNTANANSFRYLSAPVTGTTVTDWRNEIPITSIYYYDETFNTGSSTLEARYRPYTLSGALTPQGRGYSVRVNSTAAQVFDSRGTLGQGSVPVNVTAHSAGGLDGWNLIGNPYPSAIDWNLVTVPAGLNNAVYITDNFNNSGQGTGLNYVSYVDGVPSVEGYTGLVAQGQAFWVRATAPTTITFQEDDKTTTAAQFFREDSVAQVIPNILRITMAGSGLEDQTVLRLHEPATDDFDPKYDAFKLMNSKLSLMTLTNDKTSSLSINSVGSLDCDKKIQLAMVGAVKGSYQFSFTGLETFNSNLNFYLVDSLENTSVNIRDISSYSFTVSATELPNLWKRFYVTVGKAAVKTDLKALGESICSDNTLATVTLEQSQPDVQYAISYNGQTTDYVKGNGNTLALPVSTSLLTSGDNELTILAKSSSCLTLPLLAKAVITVVGKGVVASTLEGKTCDAGSVTLTATGAPESGWYNWYEGETDTTPIAGQQGASFTTPVIPKTKTYFVSVVNAAGCEGDRVAVKANVTILDPVTLSGEGTTLISSYVTGNQWYRDGVALEGATTNKIEAVESGLYTVEVTSGDCKISASREVTITASEAGLNGFGTVTIYPNPTQRKALVRVKTTNKNVMATLINASGVDLEERELKGESGVKEAEFDLGTSAIGVYYVLIVDGSKKYTEKIVKIK